MVTMKITVERRFSLPIFCGFWLVKVIVNAAGRYWHMTECHSSQHPSVCPFVTLSMVGLRENSQKEAGAEDKNKSERTS
jgi:hypothetical protein